jgi:hypothetical protein
MYIFSLRRWVFFNEIVANKKQIFSITLMRFSLTHKNQLLYIYFD